MNHPQPPPGQPWWYRPGGAPLQGGAPAPQRRWQPPPQQWQRPSQPPVQQAPWEPPRPPPTPKKSSQRHAVIGVVAGLVVIGVVAALVYVFRDGVPGGGKRLDIDAAEAGVAQILSDPIYGYGANDVEDVSCNNGDNPVIREGEGFTCRVMINGVVRDVRVVFRDSQGTYEVDGPR